MRINQRPRRRDAGPTWAAWWIKWAVILFWPLMFGLIAVEVIWLILVLGIAALAITGKRKAARR